MGRVITKNPAVAPAGLATESLDEFVRLVAEVRGVKEVVAQVCQPGIVDVTTSVAELCDDVRERIYAIEADTIRRSSSVAFDFHLREAQPKTVASELIPGMQVYTVRDVPDRGSG